MTPPKSTFGLETLFSPRDVVLVGASDRSPWSAALYSNLVTGGFRGHIHLVNHRGDRAHDQATLSSIAQLPSGIDVAFLLIGRDGVRQALVELGEHGTRAAVVLAGGYSEVGESGAAAESELVEVARRYGMLLLGPNDLGFINLHGRVRLFAPPIPDHLRAGGVAFVSQSGAMATLALRYFSAQDIGLSHVVTTGNEAMIAVEEIMDHLIDDPQTRSIALLIEGVRDPNAFRAAATRALIAGKMVVACKIGSSTVGAAAAEAHTGKLAGSDQVTDAMFRQLGITRVESVEDLIATAGAFAEFGPIRGRRLGVVTTSGGAAGLIADLAERYGVELPAFSETTRDRLLGGILPSGVRPNNPLDATGHIITNPELSSQVRGAIANDSGIDVALFTYRGAPADASEDAVSRYRMIDSGLTEIIGKSPVPVVLSAFVEEGVSAPGRTLRDELGLPNPIPSLARAVPAIGRIMQWTEWRSETFDEKVDLASEGVSGVLAPNDGWSEWTLREPLRNAGVPLVPGEIVTSADAAGKAAQKLGVPVAMKIVSSDIAHKSDVGGIRLSVSGEIAAREAYDQIMRTVASVVPEAVITGVQIAPMRPEGIELAVGVVRDPLWGLALTVGMGGIWVEVLQDVAIRVLPVSSSEIYAMLRELKAWPVLSGSRGGSAADIDAAVAAISAMVRAAEMLGDDLAALEINPLRVYKEGAEALDALYVGNAPSADDPARETDPSQAGGEK